MILIILRQELQTGTSYLSSLTFSALWCLVSLWNRFKCNNVSELIDEQVGAARYQLATFYPISFPARALPHAKCQMLPNEDWFWSVSRRYLFPSVAFLTLSSSFLVSFSSSVFAERANVSANQMIRSIAPGRRERVVPPCSDGSWPTQWATHPPTNILLKQERNLWNLGWVGGDYGSMMDNTIIPHISRYRTYRR